MANKALGIIGKGIFNMKIARGMKLNKNESEYVIDEWKGQKIAIFQNVQGMKDVIGEIEKRKARLSGDIPLAKEQFNEVKKEYRKAENPIDKRKLASKLVLRSRYLTYLQNSEGTLDATIDRVKDTIEEASIAYNMKENQIQEATLYMQINGFLQLAGKALIDARSKERAHTPEMEYQNLEFTMEKIQEEVDGRPADNLVAEADAILDQMEIKDAK